jgi:hypothetical protein
MCSARAETSHICASGDARFIGMKPNRVDTVQKQRDQDDQARQARIDQAREAESQQGDESQKGKKSEKQQHAKPGERTGESHEKQETSRS